MYLKSKDTTYFKQKIGAILEVPPTKYHNYDDMTALLNNITLRWPDVTKLYKLSQPTWGGRELWAIQISADVNRQRSSLKPMFKYVANMHGNEVVGRELLLSLPEFLLQRYYSGHNPEIERLINSTDIHLLITMNPDGFEQATLGDCTRYDDTSGRKNGRNVDLNRNFPTKDDLTEAEGRLFYGREPETRSVMRWILDNPFVLSINFHGGAVVSNYPFDDSDAPTGVISRTPDHDLFKHLATIYASNHEDMFQGSGLCKQQTFPNGITNGAEWYVVKGGMQDFNYLFTNCFEITVELSCCKYPQESDLPNEWSKNVKSLIKFIQSIHIGVKGIVSDVDGSPIGNANVIVDGNTKMIKTTERGEYWRLLLPGVYNIYAEAQNGKKRSAQFKVNVTRNEVVRLDLKLSNIYSENVNESENWSENSGCNPFKSLLKILNLFSAIVFTLFN